MLQIPFNMITRNASGNLQEWITLEVNIIKVLTVSSAVGWLF